MSEPRFAFGDRVLAESTQKTYSVINGPAWFVSDGAPSRDHWRMDSDLALAPPAPPEWEVVYSPSVGSDWAVRKGDEEIARLRHRHLAEYVRDLLNALRALP